MNTSRAPPPSPIIAIELDGDAAAFSDGAIADASQELSASAVGTVENPAEISLATVVESELNQEADVEQTAIADLLNLSATSINQVVAGNNGLATDNLFGIVAGGQLAALANAGASHVAGGGLNAVSANAASSNIVNS
ncbi:unnamed protein product [Orchesella dallaii]|uniref:Uncharacterized protein n=1 Tax=Orchesella dallaii TaxID=48710 RepID=A0ABP1RQZ3_9HEXA